MNVSDLEKCGKCGHLVDACAARQCSEGCRKCAVFCIDRCTVTDCHSVHCAEPEHKTCWEAHLPQERGPGEVHNMVDPLMRLFANAVTYREKVEARQQMLHNKDEGARWFNLVRSADLKVTKLKVWDRFNQLCNISAEQDTPAPQSFPSLTSFVGGTHVGKSTLVRAMLLLGRAENANIGLEKTTSRSTSELQRLKDILSEPNGPVTRSGSKHHTIDPTSQGVHLYRDSTTQMGENATFRPILIADCEGFGAEFQTTNSARALSKDMADKNQNGRRRKSPNSSTSSSPSRTSHNEYGHIQEDAGLIINAPIKASKHQTANKSGIELYYARFLYAMSDVVVFVTDNDGQVAANLTRILEWAVLAVHKSVNNPSRKTLILVQNKYDNFNELGDGEDVARTLFTRLKEELWQDSPELRAFVKKHNQGQTDYYKRIRTNDALFHFLFESVKCCYIPDKEVAKDNPAWLLNQYRELRSMILQASEASQKNRSKVWLNYNVPTMSHMINRAFEHFRMEDNAFDFYYAARQDNPNPRSPAEHIATLLRHAHSSAIKITDESLAEIIAVCLLTREIRSSTYAVNPDDIFNKELSASCDVAFQTYNLSHEQCGFRFTNNEKCIIRGSSTHREHISRSTASEPGEFQRPLTSLRLAKDRIREQFVRMYRELYDEGHRNMGSDATANIDNLKRLRKDVFEKHKSFWASSRSNKTCFSCLEYVPDHAVKCGHSFCERCVMDFGTPSDEFECSWNLTHCVLCSDYYTGDHYLVRLKPRCAGIRILTLDGGGIRGIIELAILKHLGRILGLGIPIREYFDLIIGTSTGGIIALGLSGLSKNIRRSSVDELMDLFQVLARKTFSRRGKVEAQSVELLGSWWHVMSMFLRLSQSKYEPSPLRDALKELFGESTSLFSSSQERGRQCAVRVAVTSKKSLNATNCLMASYNRPEFTDDSFEREDNCDKDTRVWEAGMATSAAPFYFPAFKRADGGGVDYIDGALFANCPASVALEEINKLWPDGQARLDILCSVGTGIQKRQVNIPSLLNFGGFDKMCVCFFQNLETEQAWTDLCSTKAGKDVEDRLHRLNIKITPEKHVSLDDWRKMGDLSNMVDKEMKKIANPIAKDDLRSSVTRVAHSLLGGLFYFEPDEKRRHPINMTGTNPSHIQKTKGTIRCRLAFDSTELKTLLHRVDSFWQAEVSAWSGKNHQQIPELSWTQVEFPSELREAMDKSKARFRLPITLPLSKADGMLQVVAVTMMVGGQRTERIPISGLPASLAELRLRAGLA